MKALRLLFVCDCATACLLAALSRLFPQRIAELQESVASTLQDLSQ